MKQYQKGVLYFITILGMVVILSCCRKNAPNKTSGINDQQQYAATELVYPEKNSVITCGDSVLVELRTTIDSIRIDSLSIQAGREKPVRYSGNSLSVYWSSASSRTGRNTLRINVYYNDSLHESHNVSLVALSDITPETYQYRIIQKYPHDNTAYTQGLVYDNGYLYESTGLEGKSSIRVVEISSGNPLKTVPLASKFFGEGIAIYNDMIYQITYRSKIGFIYNKSSLTQIRSFDYQIREGWGLTTDGSNLIMSDGSSSLYFIEPELFTQIDKLEVYDNKTQYDSLNELEYVNGHILANVYGQTYIIIIDPLSGKVTGRIEFRDLMPEGSIGDYNRVLNGIAYNPRTKHFYITGKNWPALYEIELIPTL